MVVVLKTCTVLSANIHFLMKVMVLQPIVSEFVYSVIIKVWLRMM